MKILRLDTQACEVLRTRLADPLQDAVPGTDAKALLMPEAA